jgi:hypothetical protein
MNGTLVRNLSAFYKYNDFEREAVCGLASLHRMLPFFLTISMHIITSFESLQMFENSESLNQKLKLTVC